jgi:polyvinyl alcohol dehydrogenase (cytochrome)
MKTGLWAGLLLVAAALASGCSVVDPAGAGGEAQPSNEAQRISSVDELVSRSGEGIDVATHPGKGLFEENCLSCHSGGVPKAPAVVWLEMLAPDAILGAMNGGIMAQQAASLSAQQRVEVAEYLTRTKLADYKPPAPPPSCSGDAAAFAGAAPAKVGWGHDNRRFVPASVGGLTAADTPGLRLKWAFEYPASNRARSQAAVGWNTVFVGSQNGQVYAFDLDTGCAKWTFRASAEVRTAIVVDADSKRLYFGDVLGRAYALDAMTGREVWRRKLDDHPNATITGAPTLGGGTLFVPVSSLEVTSAADPAYACCTFRGAVVAIDPATGKQKWKAYTIPEAPKPQARTKAGTPSFGPSGAPVWGSPTYDAKRGRVYFGSGENYSSPADGNSDALIAVDARTGKRVWQRQLTAKDAWNVGCMVGNDNCPVEDGPDYDLSASALLIPLGGDRDMIVVSQKSGMTYGIDPKDGKVVWSQRVGHGGTQGGTHFGMAAEGTTVYVPVVDMADTRDGRKYDAANSGAGIHAIDAASGRFLWRRVAIDQCNGRPYCDRGVSAAVTAIPGGVIVGHLDGRLRAYSRDTGKVLWSVDTTKPVRTLSGKDAAGGSMSGPGAAVYGRHVVVNSGYGLYYHMPGNILMVFEKAQ